MKYIEYTYLLKKKFTVSIPAHEDNWEQIDKHALHCVNHEVIFYDNDMECIDTKEYEDYYDEEE